MTFSKRSTRNNKIPIICEISACFGTRIFFEKTRKKELTKLREGGILTKLSARTDGAKQDRTKTFQELKKGLDKKKWMCYLNRVAANPKTDRLSKNFEKST